MEEIVPPPHWQDPPNLMEEARCILRQLPGSWDRRA